MGETVASLRKTLADRVKQYEIKLATINTINSALQSENDELRQQLEAAEAPKTATEAELNELREEFAHRLGALDRTIADLKKDREETLYRLEEHVEKEAKLEKDLAAKEAEAVSLKSEVKNLNEARKTFDSTYHQAQAAKDEAEGEMEFLKGRVAALEIELDDLNAKSKASLTEASTKIKELQHDLDISKENAELAVAKSKSDFHVQIDQAASSALEREEALMSNLKDMQSDSDQALLQWEQKERKLKEEIMHLECRLQGLESEKLDLQSQVSECTRPLLKQLESLMAANEKQQLEAGMAQEQLQEDLSKSITQSATMQRKYLDASEQVQGLMVEVKKKSERIEQLEETAAWSEQRAEASHQKVLELETEIDAQTKQNAADRRQASHNLKVADGQQVELAARLEASEKECEMLRSKVQLLEKQLETAQQKLLSLPEIRPEAQVTDSGLGDVAAGSQKLPKAAGLNRESGFDDDFKNMIQPTKTIERSSEVLADSQLGMLSKQVESLQRGRQQLTEELETAVNRAEASEGAMIAHQARLTELEERFGVALELLGERNERVEQLEMDINEMKGIFHQQLEICVEQINQLKDAEEVKPE